MSASLSCLFCDDIRHEVNNKHTIVGVHTKRIVVDSFPTVINKLCVYVSMYAPVDEPIKEVIFKIKCNDQVIGDRKIDDLSETAKRSRDKDRMPQFMGIQLTVTLMPLALSEESVLRVVAECDGVEVKSPGIRVVAAQPAPVADTEMQSEIVDQSRST